MCYYLRQRKVNELKNLPDIKEHNLIKRLRKQLAEVLDVQNSLRFAYALFGPGEDVLQSDWDSLIDLTHTFSELVEALCDTLSDPENIPSTISLHYYQFAVEMYQMYDQVRGLTSLMVIYRASNKSPSRQDLKHRKEIYFRLKAFTCGSNDSLQRASHILDEAYFPDQQDLDSHEIDAEEEILCEDGDDSISQIDQGYNHVLVLHRRK